MVFPAFSDFSGFTSPIRLAIFSALVDLSNHFELLPTMREIYGMQFAAVSIDPLNESVS